MPTKASFNCHTLQQPPKYQQLFRPIGGSHQAMVSKLTDSSKFKVTVKSDTDIPAIVFLVLFALFCSFSFHLTFYLFFSFFFSFFLFFFFCFFSLNYVHVTVYTYKPGHSILRSLDKNV